MSAVEAAAEPVANGVATTNMMKALVDSGPGQRAWHDMPKPVIRDRVMALTNGAGVDVAIEAVGIPATFDICQSILAAGGRLANIGVHGKPVQLHLEKPWDRNIAITTRLVDTAAIPMLLKLVGAGKLQPAQLVTHRFALADMMNAYDTFGNAATEHALKVTLTSPERQG